MMDEPSLTQTIAVRFTGSLGEQKTIALLSDEEGKAPIEDMLELDQLRGGVRRHFDQVKTEDATAADRFWGIVRFNVAIDYDPIRRSDGSELILGGHRWTGWRSPRRTASNSAGMP